MYTSSSLPRPYIGSQRNRHYIHNNLSSSSLFSNDYFFSTSKSFIPTQSGQRIYLAKLISTNTLQAQQEKRVPVEYRSSPIPLDDRQLPQEQKAKGFLSSSLFLFPTNHNLTPLTSYDRSSSSFVKEQENFRHHHHYEPQHFSYRPLNIDNKTNTSFLLEQLKQKQSLSDQNDLPEEKNSFSSSYLLNKTILNNNNDKNNQSHLLTSTPTLPSHSSHHPTTSNNILDLLSSNTNNNNKSLLKISDNILEQTSTVEHSINLLHKTDICQLNNMSSLRYSTGFDTNPTSTTHSYDQRISDQGNKYIIQIKTDDYQENEFTITPRYSSNQLIIDAKHNEEDSLGGYIRRELHKIFLIPKHIDLNKHTHVYNKNTQELTIEMPYLQVQNNDSSFITPARNTTDSLTFSYGDLNINNRGNILSTKDPRSDHHNVRFSNNDSSINTSKISTAINDPSTYDSTILNGKPFDFDLFHRSAFRPQIIQTTSNELTNNNKKLIMSLDLSDYQPEDIKVSIKDQELIVKAERKIETDTRKSRTSFFQSTSLPPQTDIEHLQSNYIDGKLTIEAPYLDRRIKTNDKQETNRQIVNESQQKPINDDSLEQRTETVIEFVRRRRQL